MIRVPHLHILITESDLISILKDGPIVLGFCVKALSPCS